MVDRKQRLALLGLALLILMGVSYVENLLFFKTLDTLFRNRVVAFFMLFVHNVTVISLVLLAMTFYVNLVVQGFFKGQKYEFVVLQHPGTFAILFAIAIVFLSILRGSNLIFGEINVAVLPQVLLVSAPLGVIEGYGIYLTIRKTLSRAIRLKDLAYIYGIFLSAAVVEVSIVHLLV